MYAIHVYWISVCFLCGRGGVGDLGGFRDLDGVERGGMDEQGDDGDDSKASFSFNKALISVKRNFNKNVNKFPLRYRLT